MILKFLLDFFDRKKGLLEAWLVSLENLKFILQLERLYLLDYYEEKFLAFVKVLDRDTFIWVGQGEWGSHKCGAIPVQIVSWHTRSMSWSCSPLLEREGSKARSFIIDDPFICA